MGQHRGQGSPLHPHVQGEDEDGVQHNVAPRPQGHGEHPRPGKALGVDEGIESQGQLDKEGAHGIDPSVVPGIGKGGLAGPKEQKEVRTKDLDHHREDQGSDHQHGGAVAQDLLGLVLFPFPQEDGGPGGAAHTHQGGKGGDAQDQRHGDPHAGEGGGAHVGDVADVHPVHQVVQ